jgi:hypothetical protein
MLTDGFQVPARDEVQALNPFEIKDWDSQVACIPGATFFHSLAWARVLQSTYGFRPHYFSTAKAGRIDSLLPVMAVESWLTGRRGVSLPFSDACEPLGADKVSGHRLIQNAKICGKKQRWKYLEFRGGRTSIGDIPASTSYFGHELNLQTDDASLFGKLTPSVRTAVRKAEQGGLKIEFSQSLEATKTFYRLLCLTRQRHGVPPQSFSFFANILKHVLAKNQGWVVLARAGNVPVAGAVFFQFNRLVVYKFGASNPKYQSLRANNLVMWAAIQKYAHEGFTHLDFGRTSIANDGLRRFKLGWGAQERLIEYFRYDLKMGRYINNPEALSPRLHSNYRLVPILLSRLVGALLYKHIAVLLLSIAWGRSVITPDFHG